MDKDAPKKYSVVVMVPLEKKVRKNFSNSASQVITFALQGEIPAP